MLYQVSIRLRPIALALNKVLLWRVFNDRNNFLYAVHVVTSRVKEAYNDLGIDENPVQKVPLIVYASGKDKSQVHHSQQKCKNGC